MCKTYFCLYITAFFGYIFFHIRFVQKMLTMWKIYVFNTPCEKFLCGKGKLCGKLIVSQIIYNIGNLIVDCCILFDFFSEFFDIIHNG